MLQMKNLKPEEECAVEELRKRTEHLDFPSRLRKDETLFYRVLKARDFNMKQAEDLLKKNVSYMNLYDVDSLLSTYTPPQHMSTYFPSSFLGYDKEGYIVRYLDLGNADFKGLAALFSFEDIMRYIIEYLERDTDLTTQQSIKLNKPITRMIYIVDMDNMNLFQVTFKKGVAYILEFIKVYQDMYPERIESIYIINASFYFNIMYSMMRSFISDGIMQKVHFYGKSGWKEAFLNFIDADVLPAFLGGDRTDPDGNPLCNSFVIHGKPVPEELYPQKQKMSLDDGVKKLKVTRASSSEIEFSISEPNTQIEWQFETKSKDIAFALYYRGENSQLKELLPKQRVDTILASETGFFNCDKVGTYIIVFDNSYSWLYSKDIYYKIRLIKPQESNL